MKLILIIKSHISIQLSGVLALQINRAATVLIFRGVRAYVLTIQVATSICIEHLLSTLYSNENRASLAFYYHVALLP